MRRIVVTLAAATLAVAPVASGSPTPLRVVTKLAPASVKYGDPVTATVEVDFDPATIAPADIHVQPSFIPYVATSRPIVRTVGRGALTYTYTLLCVTEGCLPTKGQKLLRLEPVTATVSGGAKALGRWPTLQISSRLTPRDLSGPVRFRSPSTPPAPSYRIAPGRLAGALIAAAVVWVLAALGLLATRLARRRGRGAEPRLTSLELAIAYVRDSAQRSGSDRRRALSLLAEATDEGEHDLSIDADESAWSRRSPTPVAAAELADRASHLGSAE
jgi:hypothetical protein